MYTYFSGLKKSDIKNTKYKFFIFFTNFFLFQSKQKWNKKPNSLIHSFKDYITSQQQKKNC